MAEAFLYHDDLVKLRTFFFDRSIYIILPFFTVWYRFHTPVI
jgi:hypothetical protein